MARYKCIDWVIAILQGEAKPRSQAELQTLQMWRFHRWDFRTSTQQQTVAYTTQALRASCQRMSTHTTHCITQNIIIIVIVIVIIITEYKVNHWVTRNQRIQQLYYGSMDIFRRSQGDGHPVIATLMVEWLQIFITLHCQLLSVSHCM